MPDPESFPGGRIPQNCVSWHIILRPVGGMRHHLSKWDLGLKQV